MPWKATSVVEERIKFVVAASRGEPISGLCREFGISRPTGYKWIERHRADGLMHLEDRSRRPRTSPQRTPAKIEQAVCELRQRYPDWGAPKLVRIFAQQHPELGGLSERTVHRILKRHGLIAETRSSPALQRFERSEPNELLQMDFKGPQGFNTGSPVGPLSILDDHSRYLLCLEHLGSTRAAGVQRALEQTFTRYGLPRQILVDHGTPWWAGGSPWGLTELRVWILRQGVELIYSGLRHPQTQGKVERMHGALQRAIRQRKGDPEDQAWLDAFRDEYNHVRPHAGIGMQTPASRWRPSPRCYPQELPPFVYPASVELVRLGQRGRLRWNHRDWRISEALSGLEVGVERIGERAVVWFRSTPLRELDLQTGANRPLPLPFPSSLSR
jgi:transposase InsO family protein